MVRKYKPKSGGRFSGGENYRARGLVLSSTYVTHEERRRLHAAAALEGAPTTAQWLGPILVAAADAVIESGGKCGWTPPPAAPHEKAQVAVPLTKADRDRIRAAAALCGAPDVGAWVRGLAVAATEKILAKLSDAT